MTLEEKLSTLAEILDLDESSEEGLKPENDLADIEEWDSLAALSFVVLMQDKFGKAVTGKQVRGFKTVQDLLDCMM